jgi:eukaryotic-like serine/threonine-protein kinase
LKPERWRQVEEVLEAALKLQGTRRVEFLETSCAEDQDLRKEVESLLAQEARAGTFIEDSALIVGAKALAQDAAASGEAPPSPGITGKLVSHYRILDKLGEGGMGAVYRAVRADDEYQKQVAIKLVRPDLKAGFVLDRFKNERQILANLEHSNIARLLDGGTTGDGLPFFVMELVEGRPVDHYCDSLKLSIPERLQLFLSVCSAVQYAHRHLVIHCDLKPGNILVTGDGAPKLLDFGIAKILDPDALSHGSTVTLQRMMTPEYASPEQLLARPVSTATDVYSLGVVLYCLLTGRLPYRLPSRSPYELAQAICDLEPERPSLAAAVITQGRTAASSELLANSRQLSGDLDHILLKALRKEPEQRYVSVEQFSEDIRRHLKGLPVMARQGTFAYLGAKFVKRHRAGVIAAACAVLALVAGMAAIAREARIAEAQRARAEHRFSDVRELANSLMFDINDSIQNLPGATAARNLLVNKALHYLNSLALESAGDTALQRELARGYQKVGDIQGLLNSQQNLGNTSAALQSYREAAKIAETLASAGDAEAMRELGGLYRKVAELLALRNDAAGAAGNDRNAVRVFEQLYSANPHDDRATRDLVAAYTGVGRHLGFSGEYARASEYEAKALDLIQRLIDAHPKDKTLNLTWASLSRQACYSLSKTGELHKALPLCRRAVDITEKIAAANPNDMRSRLDVSFSYSDLGRALTERGDLTSALEAWRKAMTIAEAVRADDPRDARAQVSLGSIYERAGWLLAKTTPSTGLEYELKSLEFRKVLSAADPANLGRQEAVASSYSTLGDVEAIFASRPGIAASQSKNHWRLALSWYRQSLDILLRLRANNALRGTDRAEPDRVAKQIAFCDAALGKEKTSSRD